MCVSLFTVPGSNPAGGSLSKNSRILFISKEIVEGCISPSPQYLGILSHMMWKIPHPRTWNIPRPRTWNIPHHMINIPT